MALYRDRGVVLRTYRLGEADRIIVLLTQGNGKVRAVAKGVRKTKSKFGARLEPTSHVNLQLYEGRELDIVTQVETIDSFRSVREDLDKLGRAASILEVVDQMSLDREANARLYRMLVGALGTIERTDSPLVVPAFFCKMLAAEGFGPQVDACVQCGTTELLTGFSVVESGLTCRTCRHGMTMSADAIELLRNVLGGGLVAALEAPQSPATHEVERIATALMEHHLERRLRSVGLLDKG